jgi:hypothetical protein
MADFRMAMSKRLPRNSERDGVGVVGVNGGGNDDDKQQKVQLHNNRLVRIAGLICVVLGTLLWLQPLSYDGVETELNQGSTSGSTGGNSKLNQGSMSGSTSGNSNSKNVDYELYPFLVSQEVVTSSVIASDALLSNPTLPKFPVISRLEECKLAYKPSEKPRAETSEWRPKFWIPSFSGSGSSNPAKKGDVVRILIEGLFSGENGNTSGSYLNPVKDFHVSIKKRLKRCKGVSETVGCTCSHPMTPVKPETQKDEFRSEAILSIRNPATVIPVMFANKNIAYHDATKQAPVKEWRNNRDRYFEGTFTHWMGMIKFWRGTAEESSYYFTRVYVPYEDLVTTIASKGVATIKELSDAISGRNNSGNKNENFFETSSSTQDYECLWYRSAKKDWEYQQQIIGDYIPAYTQAQKDRMVKELNDFADEVEKEPSRGEQDAALVSLLRRYANQIETYVRVEEPQEEAPKR